ncbi:MAG TPA: folylpolyglutamate synthase/dihydrofolate synthase family protein [Thermotogota bacterium]|nr:folylpolyglutamate synthase/dihydrofolate synthase family protein [Thermotogota bacterium]HRW91750.1 folylpolyglutamate synthase/dihydrofolate synthase family protein [Thermotogota bacterium]
MFESSKQVIEFLYTSRPHGQVKLGLERIQKLLALLGNPQQHFSSIQVAGTNGKGSVTRTLETLFREQGFSTGGFFSPHLIDFRERISLDGVPVDAAALTGAMNRVYPAVQQMDAMGEDWQPSFFELVTALAFTLFQEKGVELALVEVGMGGRLDATTALSPDLFVITHIGLDHTKTLGTTLEQIAGEKAGILKQGGTLVCGVRRPEALQVIEQVARQKEVHVERVDRDFFTRALQFDLDNNLFVFENTRGEGGRFSLRLNGTHQVENAGVALQAFFCYCRNKGFAVSLPKVQQALASVKWIGRFERIGEQPLILVDGAHNPDGVEKLLENWDLYFPGESYVLLVGMLKDKETSQMVPPLCQKARQVVVTDPNMPGRVDSRLVVQAFQEQCGESRVFYEANMEKALHLALEKTQGKTPLVITGSLYLIGYLRKMALERKAC